MNDNFFQKLWIIDSYGYELFIIEVNICKDLINISNYNTPSNFIKFFNFSFSYTRFKLSTYRSQCNLHFVLMFDVHECVIRWVVTV